MSVGNREGHTTFVYDGNGRIVDVKTKGNGSSSGGGGCDIATATLTGGDTETQLNWLRNWRDQVLTKTSLGQRLEGYYDWTGPTVAEWIANNPLLASTFLYPFVKPAVWLAQRRAMSGAFKPVIDLSIYLLFLLGLAYGSLVYWLHPFRANRRLLVHDPSLPDLPNPVQN